MTVRNRIVFQCLLLVFALFATNAIAAPDYVREKRWAEEIAPAVVVGDAVYLAQKSGHRFLAIYTEARQPRAAVIVVHGLGVHPDWALNGALRSGLADQGYTTLSVQMPVLAADAKADAYPPLFPDAADRLQVAIEFLKARGYGKIAIASHSLGGRMSNLFLAGTPGHGISAWISVGIMPSEFAEPAKLQMPVLDIYGERDFPQVLQQTNVRAAALKTLKGSAQIEVAGADHYFTGREAELVRQARLFLDQRLK